MTDSTKGWLRTSNQRGTFVTLILCTLFAGVVAAAGYQSAGWIGVLISVGVVAGLLVGAAAGLLIRWIESGEDQ